jgi:tRNA threonylcarbamoyladenosine biosynthesis protein TsaE
MNLTSLEDTAALAQHVARSLSPGTTVALCGPLGAGKTTLTRELVRALGGIDPVSSPTFVLEHEYRTTSGVVVCHWDLYRLAESPPELSEPPGPAEIRLVEWAYKVPAIVATADLTVTLQISVTGDVLTRSVLLQGRLASNLAVGR